MFCWNVKCVENTLCLFIVSWVHLKIKSYNLHDLLISLVTGPLHKNSTITSCTYTFVKNVLFLAYYKTGTFAFAFSACFFFLLKHTHYYNVEALKTIKSTQPFYFNSEYLSDVQAKHFSHCTESAPSS